MPSEEHAAPPGNPFAPQPAPVIPDHELLRLIGRGAYGEVWLARNAIGTLRAVKIVHRQSFERTEYFEREFKGLLKFEPISRSHEGLVHVLQIGRRDDAGYFFYVMELADGLNVEREVRNAESKGAGAQTTPHSALATPHSYTPRTLRSELQARGSLPPAECVALGLKLASALEHLHANGLVHRDIKPSNIIFVNGEPKLADIGLVTAIDEAQSLVDTARYITPEGPGTPQADLYSLGKVLYEIAFDKDRQEFPQLPPDLQSHPEYKGLLELNEIILKACETDPRLRYASAAALREDLELLQRGKSVKQKLTRQKYWAVAKKALATAAVLGVIFISATVLLRQSRVVKPLSANPQAEELYQQAVYEMNSQELERIQQAYTNLTEAVKLDPGFVDAYYKMFETYFTDFGDKLPPHYNQAANVRMVAEKLRMLSPDSAEYHVVDSFVKFHDWKFDEAIEEAALAKKINPNFVRAHGLNAWYLELAHGDAVAALREYRIAEQLDSSDAIIQCVLGGPYYLERKYDQAIEQYQRAVKLEPRGAFARENLAAAYEANKQYDEAIDEYEQFDLLSGADPAQTRAWYQKMRTALHEKGPRGWWQAQLDGARLDPHADPYWLARLNGRLGNINEIFSFLNQAYKEHDGSMILLLEDDCWDPFRADQRFQELLKTVGFHPTNRFVQLNE